MDDIDRKIIDLLSGDARRSLADIGAAVSLSPSSVNERIKKLLADGVIKRFTIDIDPAKLALPVAAFVWIALREGADEAAFRAFAREDRHVSECHHVTGAWSYLLKVQVADLAALERFLATLKESGFLARSETVIALSTVVAPPFRVKDT
ncbi:Lrp/AsnC family transcriptional regulator [Afifella pfennigii]|uniref:Lrp/AsnC family transcriptional regulator n=1 Tax=Afifella pfennigii TaxID=209897 RepID=UPI00047A733F|nr:Lrp/AsnC family transcriptional regulator [Afifella pfennigii]